MDQAELPGMAGTVAGDDTIFIACTNTAHAAKLARLFQRMKS
jgi:arginine repressor